MHDQKRNVIAAAIAALSFASTVSAQKDAAEKAKEGSIEHWIEYYKGEQRKAAAPSPQEPVAPYVDRTEPVERTESDGQPRKKAN